MNGLRESESVDRTLLVGLQPLKLDAAVPFFG